MTLYQCGMWAGAVVGGVLLSASITLALIITAGHIQRR